MQKSLFVIEKIQKYRKCPALLIYIPRRVVDGAPAKVVLGQDVSLLLDEELDQAALSVVGGHLEAEGESIF